MSALAGSGSTLPTASNRLTTQGSHRLAYPSFPIAWLAVGAQFTDMLLLIISGWLASRVCELSGLAGDAGEGMLATALATISTFSSCASWAHIDAHASCTYPRDCSHLPVAFWPEH